MKLIRYTVCLGVIALGLAGCSSEEEEAEIRAAEESQTEVDSTSIEMISQIEPLPSPMQIAFLFQKASLEYRQNTAADPANSEKYVGTISKLLALGVYSADFTYSVLNERGGVAKEYLLVIEDMAKDLGIANVYNTPQNIRRIEQNIGNFDSLSYILTDIQMQADKYLYDQNEMERGAIIFAGAWLESMYLGVMTKDLQSNPELLDVIIEQDLILNNLIEHLAAIKKMDLAATDTDVFTKTLGHLYELQKVFDSMNIPSDYSMEVTITRDQLERLSQEIIEARKYVVNKLAGLE